VSSYLKKTFKTKEKKKNIKEYQAKRTNAKSLGQKCA
jgi:hypothetical protein